MGNDLSYRKIKSENIKDILEDYENALKNDEHKDFFNKRLLPKLSNSNIYNKNDNENINKIFELKLPFIRAYGIIRQKSWEIKLSDYNDSIGAFIFHLARIDVCYLENIVIKECRCDCAGKSAESDHVKIIMLCFILVLLKYGVKTIEVEDKQSTNFINRQMGKIFDKQSGVNIQLINMIDRSCSSACMRSDNDWTVIREVNDKGILTLSVHNKIEIIGGGKTAGDDDENDDVTEDYNKLDVNDPEYLKKTDELTYRSNRKFNREAQQKIYDLLKMQAPIRTLNLISTNWTVNRTNRALITGGDQTEIYDVDKKEFKEGPSMNHPRYGHCSVTLYDGTIFICCGYDPVNRELVRQCEIFSPRTMKFTDVCDLLIPRMDADAVLLKDGRVFIVGGFVINDESEATKTAEIFNPMTEKCVMSKSEIPVPRGIAGMSACRDNSDTFVFICGGESGVWKSARIENGRGVSYNVSYSEKFTFLYDPDADKFIIDTNSVNNRKVILDQGFSGHRCHTIPNNKVLIMGGDKKFERSRSTLIFDWVENQFLDSKAKMIKARVRFFCVDIGDKLMIGGGCEGEGGQEHFKITELYDAKTQEFTRGPSLLRNHNYTCASSYNITQTELENEERLLTFSDDDNNNNNNNNNMDYIMQDVMEGID